MLRSWREEEFRGDILRQDTFSWSESGQTLDFSVMCAGKEGVRGVHVTTSFPEWMCSFLTVDPNLKLDFNPGLYVTVFTHVLGNVHGCYGKM